MEFSSTIQNLYYIIQNLYVCKGIVTNMEVSFYKHIFYTVGFLMSTLCHLIEQQSQRAFVNRYKLWTLWSWHFTSGTGEKSFWMLSQHTDV